MKKGDKRTQEIFDYISNYVTDNGFPPSVREVAQKFAIKSTSTVHYYFDKMKNAGLINYEPNKKRAISLNSSKQTANYVPLIGKVSAGQGILAFENPEGAMPLPADIFGGKNLFVLRVDGDSMIDAGICNGDFVVVNSQNDADEHDIVVVFWQDKATVKRLLARTPNLVLHPENKTMSDIVIAPEDNPQILGKVVGCIKKF